MNNAEHKEMCISAPLRGWALVRGRPKQRSLQTRAEKIQRPCRLLGIHPSEQGKGQDGGTFH